MEKATKVHLLGKLGKLFGQEWNLFVKSPAEALRAIDVNTKGAFFKYLSTEGAKKHYKIGVQNKKNLLDKEELKNRTGENDIFIMPTIKGSGGVAKAIAGAVLVVVGAVLSYYHIPGGQFLINTGIALMLGGIVELLTPIPKKKQNDQAQSANFQGNAAAANQGVPVPVIYGRALASPIPVCVSYGSYTTSTTRSGPANSVQITPLPGGGYQYSTVLN